MYTTGRCAKGVLLLFHLILILTSNQLFLILEEFKLISYIPLITFTGKSFVIDIHFY